jgi:hypothetical protein
VSTYRDTDLPDIRIQHREQVLFPLLRLIRPQGFAELLHHPLGIASLPQMRRTEDASDPVTHTLMQLTIFPYQCLLAICLTACEGQTGTRSRLERVALESCVNQGPVGDAAVPCQRLLRQCLFAAQIGWQRECASPFCAIQVELNLLFFFGRMHKSEGGGVSAGKVDHGTHVCRV